MKKEKTITTRLMTITPDIAKKMLKANTDNRSLSDSVVTRYVQDMRAGRWGVSETAFCFTGPWHAPGSRLINGQHRLEAVVRSRVTIRAMVAEGYPEDAIHYIDDSFARTNLAVYNLSHENKVTNAHMAIARIIEGPGSDWHGKSRQAIYELLERHKEAIDFTVGLFSAKRVKGITAAFIMVVIARAYYSADHDKLRRFCEVLLTGGYTNDVEKTILLLRDALLKTSGNSREQRTDKYWRAERALKAFLDNQKMTKLYAAQKELFPIPGGRK